MSALTAALKRKLIQLFVDDITSGSSYYIFMSRYSEWTNEAAAPDEVNSQLSLNGTLMGEMWLGKKIEATDLAFMIEDRLWEANTVYTQFDDRETDLSAKEFFVVNTNRDVYKCLFNNYGNPSTVEPTTVSNVAFTHSEDGYMWKYMYSITTAYDNKFSEDDLAPVVTNANVVNSAANGAIHVVLIETSGEDYKTTSGTVQEVISSTVLRIEASSMNANGYYEGSGFYISEGAASGSLAVISAYHANSSGKYVTLDTAIGADLTSQYLISPYIAIDGDGTGAKAYCTVNDTTGSLETVTMITTGSDYSFATVTAQANVVHGSGATLRAIIPPKGGHGVNARTELFANTLMISVNVSGSEGNTIPTGIPFRQVGVINAPLAYGTSDAFDGEVFTAMYQMSISNLTSGEEFEIGSRLRGAISGATGAVAHANSSVVFLTQVVGTFTTSDRLASADSLVTADIDAINTPTIEPLTGDVFAFDNITSITRTDETDETVKAIIEF